MLCSLPLPLATCSITLLLDAELVCACGCCAAAVQGAQTTMTASIRVCVCVSIDARFSMKNIDMHSIARSRLVGHTQLLLLPLLLLQQTSLARSRDEVSQAARTSTAQLSNAWQAAIGHCLTWATSFC